MGCQQRYPNKEIFEHGTNNSYLVLPGVVVSNKNGEGIVNGSIPESEAVDTLVLRDDGFVVKLDAEKDRPSGEQPWNPAVSWIEIINGDIGYVLDISKPGLCARN